MSWNLTQPGCAPQGPMPPWAKSWLATLCTPGESPGWVTPGMLLSTNDEELIRDGQFNRGGNRNPRAAHRRLVDHRRVRPLRSSDVIYFAAHLHQVQSVLRVNFIQP